MEELISLIRSSKCSKSKSFFLVLFTAASFALAQEELLYDSLWEKINNEREESYKLFITQLRDIEAKLKGKKEIPEEIKEREYETLPQKVKEWQKENGSSTLLSLRLKIVLAQLEKKPALARDLESQLSSMWQSLLSEWITLPPTKESPPKKEEIILPFPPPPSSISPWWKSSSLTYLPPPSEKLEGELKNKIASFTQQVDKTKRQTLSRLDGYEKILKEVKKRCPLP
ncbi:MAG: hypothetical protein ACPLPS_02285 [bacterium]